MSVHGIIIAHSLLKFLNSISLTKCHHLKRLLRVIIIRGYIYTRAKLAVCYSTIHFGYTIVSELSSQYLPLSGFDISSGL